VYIFVLAFVTSMLLRNIALCMATELNGNGCAFSCLKLHLNHKTSSAY